MWCVEVLLLIKIYALIQTGEKSVNMCTIRKWRMFHECNYYSYCMNKMSFKFVAFLCYRSNRIIFVHWFFLFNCEVNAFSATTLLAFVLLVSNIVWMEPQNICVISHKLLSVQKSPIILINRVGLVFTSSFYYQLFEICLKH